MRLVKQIVSLKSNLNKGVLLTALGVAGPILVAGVVFAATNIFSGLESESGSRAGNVSVVADASASGASTVKFGQQAAPAGTCPVADQLTITSANQADYPAYALGTKVYVPGGPDPWRDGTDTLSGCFPGPTNTGVPAGTTLTDYVSTLPARDVDAGHLNDNFYFTSENTCYIKAPNTVIQNKEINCSLRIRSKDVQIKNSLVRGVIYIDDTWCVGSGSGTSSFTLTDSTVINPSAYGGRTLGLCDYTLVRAKVSGGPSVGVCTNCTIKDSYLFLDETSADPVNGINHNSVMRVGPNANLVHNTFQCLVPTYENTGATSDPTEESGCSADQTAYSHDGLVPHDSTLKRNFYMSTSGGYCAWGGSTSGDTNLNDGVHDIKFIENIFQRKSVVIENKTRGTTSRSGTNCGIFGPIANFYDRPGHVWQCNRWDNGAVFPSPISNPTYTQNISC